MHRRLDCVVRPVHPVAALGALSENAKFSPTSTKKKNILLSILETIEWSKKPSHATVPLEEHNGDYKKTTPYLCGPKVYLVSHGAGVTLKVLAQPRIIQDRSILKEMYRHLHHQGAFTNKAFAFLCPFAEYYIRYAVTSFFTISRISLAEGKRAGQKVHRTIAVAVQNVKPLYFLSRSFEIREKYCQ